MYDDDTKIPLRDILAYSKLGRLTAHILQRTIYKNSRIHWIIDCLAGYNSFNKLEK